MALLSCDLVAVEVIDSDGELLAGEASDHASGAQLSATADGLTIAATIGPQGLPRLLQHDLQTAAVAMHR